jgi:hypothetical protein
MLCVMAFIWKMRGVLTALQSRKAEALAGPMAVARASTCAAGRGDRCIPFNLTLAKAA